MKNGFFYTFRREIAIYFAIPLVISPSRSPKRRDLICFVSAFACSINIMCHPEGSVADSRDPAWRSTTILFVLGYSCFATSAIQSTQYVTCHIAFTKSVGRATTEAEKSLAIIIMVDFSVQQIPQRK